MNHLFWNITWLRYTELLALALVIYYLYVGLRWYRTDIANLFRRGRSSSMLQREQQPLRICDVEGPDATTASASMQQTMEPPQNPSEAEMLTTALLASIAESSSHPYEPERATKKLKAILQRYPQLRNSPRRAAITSLVVAECEKTGIARLSEQDVDQWWED